MSYTKSTTALLAVGVIAVWSLVAAKAIKWLRPSGEPVVHKAEVADARDGRRATLGLDHRRPCLGDVVGVENPTVQSGRPAMLEQPQTTPSFAFRGMMSGLDGKVALVERSGKMEMFKEGEWIDEFRVVSISATEMVVKRRGVLTTLDAR